MFLHLLTMIYRRPDSSVQLSLRAWLPISFLIPFALLTWACQPDASVPPYHPLEFELAKSQDLYVPEGWEVSLWAESPDLYNPTNLDVDHRGRVWVTEAVNYRDFNNPASERLSHPEGDRVLILEDTDQDGKADVTKVFVQDQDLVAPVGIAVFGPHVVVSCSPHVLIYTDEDGDDKADKKEKFLTGFGGFDHDHSVHAVVAGPDGKWYFNTGNAGPHTVTDKGGWTLRSGSMYTGGSPYNQENEAARVSDDGKVWVGGLALRIQPDGHGLEVVGHNFRNAYELTIDSYGNMWQNDNDDQVQTCRFTWLMEGGNAGYFSADGSRNWRNDQRPHQAIFTAHWHQDDPGVIPAGDCTGAGSPTGVAVYEGDLFGAMYRGMLLSVDAGRNAVFAYQPKPAGAGFELDRKDLIVSHTQSTEDYQWNATTEDQRLWFRPSDLAVGTEGALYLADWFDPVVGGHQMKERKGYGRIYRIVPKGSQAFPPTLDLSQTDGQLQALFSPAINVRHLGFQALKAQGAAVIPELEAAMDGANAFQQARLIWLMAQLGAEGQEGVRAFLQHPHDALAVSAFRALRQVLPKEELLALCSRLAGDDRPALRRELALALRAYPWEEIQEPVMALINNWAPDDRWYLEAIGMALDGKAERAWPALLATFGAEAPAQWDDRFFDLTWRLHPPAAVEALAAIATSEEQPIDRRKRAVVALGVVPQPEAAKAMLALQRAELPDVRQHAAWWVQFRRTNDWYDWLPQAVPTPAPLAARSPDEQRATSVDEARVLALAGEVASGQTLFAQRCGSCHQHGKLGQDIGPDLSQIHQKFDATSLLEALLYPEAGVVFGYEGWEVTTRDERTLTGLLLADGKTMVLKDLAGQQHVIPAEEVRSKRQLPGSLMPAATALGLNEQDLADVIAFLLGSTS